MTFALLDVDDDGRQELLESRPDGEGGSILSLFAFDGRTYDEVARIGGGHGETYRLLTESVVTFGGRSGVLVAERPAGLGENPTQLALWSPCHPS